MTVWANSAVVDQWNVTGTSEAGPFSAVGGNGRLAVPHHNEYGVLDETTYNQYVSVNKFLSAQSDPLLLAE